MTFPPDSLAYKMIELPGVGALRAFDFMTSVSTDNRDVLNADSIEFCNLLKKNWGVFRDEYLQLLDQKKLYNVKDFYKVRYDVKHDENWQMFPLLLFNYRFIENTAKCIGSFELIKQIPGCTTAMFSVLGPGKHVPPHRGIYKGTYRCLLGLIVPDEEKCWIKINGKKMPFREGECMVFDETFEHEAANESDLPRIVLYLDIYRKLPFPVNMLNDMLFYSLRKSPFIQNVLNEYRKLDSATFENFIPKAALLR